MKKPDPWDEDDTGGDYRPLSLLEGMARTTDPIPPPESHRPPRVRYPKKGKWADDKTGAGRAKRRRRRMIKKLIERRK